MNKITYLIKELRERTGAGVIDCKKALIETNGDINLAIEKMYRSSSIKAKKKSIIITTQGMISTKIKNNYGVILEINCQTDFVSKSHIFQEFVKKVLNVAINEKINEIKKLQTKFEKEKKDLITKIGENINIRRLACLQGDLLGSYQHRGRIGVLVSLMGTDNAVLVKHLAMHIAASNPKFINPEDISSEIIEQERHIQFEIAIKSRKPMNIVEKIVDGRIKKFTDEISLTKQFFIMDPNKTITQLLKEHNASVTKFIRFEVGEIVEKSKYI